MADFLAQNPSLSVWQRVNGAFPKRILSHGTAVTGQSFPYRLYLKEISVPKSMFRQVDQKSYDVGLNIMLYDSKLMTFDNPLSSPTKQLSLANKASFEMMLYFILDRLEPSTFLVVEVLSRQKNAYGVVEEICIGFAALKLDIQNPSLQTIRLTGGSSRALLFIEDPSKITSPLPDDVSIALSVQTWPKLEAMKHLLPPNVLVHSAADIPGVISGSTNPEYLAVGVDNFYDPRILDFKIPCRLTKINIRMRPDVTNVEALIQNNLNLEVEQNPKNVTKLKTTARKLKVGLHNGLRYVFEPTVVPLMLSADGALAIEPGAIQELAMQLPHHPAFVIVFHLELVFSEIVVSSIFKKTTPKVFSVFAGWAAFSPFGTPALPQSSTLTLHVTSSPNDSIYNPEDILACSLKSESEPTHMNDILLEFTITGNWTDTPNQAPTLPPHFQQPSPMPQPVPPIALGQPPQMPSPQELIQHQLAQPYQQMASSRSFQPATPQAVANMPDLSVFGPQRPWPVEVRHLVDDEQKGTLIGTTVVHRHPSQNLTVTPVHISMPPIPPLTVASLPRAAYAQLYAAGFPVIRDRHGDLPEVIDPVASSQNYLSSLNFAAEKADPLQGNEIVFQFLALSSFTHATTAALDQPQCVFFTFQFYNFPPVQTERMLMTCGDKLIVNDPNERMSSIFILRAMDKQTGAIAVQPPGCQVKFAVDSSVLKPGEEEAFWQYVLTQSLHIDVWDGDSLMLIGSCSVPVRFLLRQGKEAVQMTFEMDVFSTEYGSLTSNIIADVTRAGSARYIDVAAVLKGRLHLRLANIGYVSEMRPIVGKSSALAKIYGGSSGRLAVVESQNAQTGNQAGSLDKRLNFLADQTNRPISGRTRIGQGAHLLEAAGNRALLDPGGALAGVSLASDLMGAAAAGETIDDRARKLERFRKLLTTPEVKGQDSATLAHGAAVLAYKQARETREHGFQNLESYRDRTKHQSIISLLCEAITSHHEIVASFGKAEYFEFTLRNPTNEQHMVRIESQDPDLTVVTDVAEWRYFRKTLGEPTGVVEEKMFNVDAKSPLIPEVFIKPREIIRIPFRFQTFKGYQSAQENEPDSKQPDAKSFSLNSGIKQLSKSNTNNRSVTVHFTSITNKGEHVTTEVNGTPVRPLAVLEVNVQLQPHATDQVFRFYAPENSFLRKAIRLPPYSITAPGASQEQINELRRFTVRCSDSALVAEVRNNGPNEPQDIMLRIAVGASPNIRKVFLGIFADPYVSVPLQIWELWLHALQRYDVTCVEGETSKFSLVLRGTNSTRLVRCFTSHANELLVEPSIPFMLVGNTVHELSFTLKPLSAGQRLMVVNVVDLQLRQLLRSWLVCVSAESPSYSSYFDLVLPVGAAGQTHNKKLAYKNPFGRTQSFFLKTNRSDLLSLRDQSMPQMAPGETRDIGLRFAASQIAGTAELAVYVNDDQDRNIESVCIRLAYVNTHAPPGLPQIAPTNQPASVVA